MNLTARQSARANEHVLELGRKYGIRVRRVSTWRKAGAFWSSRTVYVARDMLTQIDYLSALHEFGHIVYQPSSKRVWAAPTDQKAELVCEAAAWAWALGNVDPAVVRRMSPTLRNEIGGCWTSFFHQRDFGQPVAAS